MEDVIPFEKILAKAKKKEALSLEEAKAAMTWLISAKVKAAEIAAFLTAIHEKGVTEEELFGFALKMRERAQVPELSEALSKISCMDNCGTGGGTIATFNISTVSAFIVAACGIPVAKHGNRAITSRAGSADVLEKCGIPLELSPHSVLNCLKKVGIGFLYAPQWHQATAHVQKVRKELPHKTFFNLLGPLTNPFCPQYQLVGVYDPNLTEIMAKVLAKLGAKKCLVVHGYGETAGEGMDEVSLLGKTKISEWDGKKIKNYEFDPESWGLRKVSKKNIAGGTPEENALLLRNILAGKETGLAATVVSLNAVFGLIASEKIHEGKEGLSIVKEVIKSGLALKKLMDLIEVSQNK